MRHRSIGVENAALCRLDKGAIMLYVTVLYRRTGIIPIIRRKTMMNRTEYSHRLWKLLLTVIVVCGLLPEAAAKVAPGNRELSRQDRKSVV